MLKVANIFSNDMVLQRDKNITVWGLGDEERTVTVTLNGVSFRRRSATAGGQPSSLQ